MTLDGEALRFTGADDALAKRIVTVHQDINLVQTMTVAENLLLNNEPTYGFGVIRRRDDARDGPRACWNNTRSTSSPTPLSRTAERPEEDGADRQGGAPRPPDPPSRRADLVADRDRGAGGAAADPHARRRTASASSSSPTICNEIFEVCDDLTVMRDGEVVADGPVAETTLPQVVTPWSGGIVEIVAAQASGRSPQRTRRAADAGRGSAVPGRLHKDQFRAAARRGAGRHRPCRVRPRRTRQGDVRRVGRRATRPAG